MKTALSENVPLAEAILQLRAAGHPGLPGPKEIEAGQWTPAQERALAQLISMDLIRRVWIGSLEVTELVRRQLAAELASAAAAQFSLPAEQRLHPEFDARNEIARKQRSSGNSRCTPAGSNGSSSTRSDRDRRNAALVAAVIDSRSV